MPSEGPRKDHLERKLAAILAADIAGYSALMEANKEATVRDLKAHQAVILPMIAEHGGHIIDTAGDGILAEFASVVNAVECAVAVQKVMADRNASSPIERQMRYRIGVNLGDVIHDKQRVYGDGVNIAARLESFAEPGGICISGAAFEQVQRRVQFAFVDTGEHQLKNISNPVRVYRIDTTQQFRGPPQARVTLALPDKPSIAVLPFTNLSGDPDQEYFGDGIAEDILTDLAKLRWLFVIARNSSFTFRGKAVDVRLVSRELGVRYVLEGSVRRAGNRIRVVGQLIDATTGAHVWASRYDRELADIFAVQDEITAAIATAIAPAIVDAEQQRALHKAAERLDAWEALHRGMWHFAIGNRENCEMARGFFQKAVDLDPNFAAAHVALVGIALRSGIVLYTMSLDEAARAGERLAQRALSLDPSDPLAHARLAQAVWASGDLEGCIAECNEALSLDGNCAIAHGVKGDALVFFAGRREEGRASIRTYLRLTPRDPARAARLHNVALSHYLDGNYEVAVEACRDVIRRYGHGATYRWLLASLGQLGRLAECEALMKIAPPDYDHYARHRPPWFGLKDFEHMLEGLRKAGWSE
jgi:adenylate cyclase